MSDEEKKEDEEETRGDEEGDVNRRSFFTEGFRHMLKPLADVVESRMEKVPTRPSSRPCPTGRCCVPQAPLMKSNFFRPAW